MIFEKLPFAISLHFSPFRTKATPSVLDVLNEEYCSLSVFKYGFVVDFSECPSQKEISFF